MMHIDDIKQVLIVGSGNMGQQVGFQAAVSGYNVVLYYIAQSLLDKAMDRIGKLAKTYIAAMSLMPCSWNCSNQPRVLRLMMLQLWKILIGREWE